MFGWLLRKEGPVFTEDADDSSLNKSRATFFGVLVKFMYFNTSFGLSSTVSLKLVLAALAVRGLAAAVAAGNAIAAASRLLCAAELLTSEKLSRCIALLGGELSLSKSRFASECKGLSRAGLSGEVRLAMASGLEIISPPRSEVMEDVLAPQSLEGFRSRVMRRFKDSFLLDR